MSDSKDIIQTALDTLTGNSQAVRVLVQHRGNRPAVMWYGRLTGLGSQGKDATITVTDVRPGVGAPVIPGHILLDVDDVLELINI